jgi:hypothetical protein
MFGWPKTVVDKLLVVHMHTQAVGQWFEGSDEWSPLMTTDFW